MIINTTAICSRKINNKSSAMFEVSCFNKSLIGTKICIGVFEREIISFIVKNKKKYVICSKPELK